MADKEVFSTKTLEDEKKRLLTILQGVADEKVTHQQAITVLDNKTMNLKLRIDSIHCLITRWGLGEK